MEDPTAVSRNSGMLSVSLNSGSSLTLTPGRTRNIAQDMEALRLSRQDNPFLQQVMASRESLIESSHEENDSDDAVLMAQEFCNSSIDLLAEDPITLKEVHDHMIRSPPPISYWPHDSVSQRGSSAFDFSSGNSPHSISFSALSINNSDHTKDVIGSTSTSSSSVPRKSPLRVMTKLHNSTEESYLHGDFRTNVRNNNASIRTRSSSRPISPKPKDPNVMRPLSLPGESHLKNALGRSRQQAPHDRFSILHHPVPIRRTVQMSEDSIHLVQDSDK